MGKKDKRKKQGQKKHHFVRNTFIILAVLFCFVVFAGVGIVAYYVKDAPKLEDAKLVSQPTTRIYDRNNTLIQNLGDSRRDIIATNEVPQQLKDAVVSIEDRRFYKHIGVDPIRIAGAFFSNLKGNALQGGSTLTQQLIKLSYFSTTEQDQTLRRKIQEAWLSIQLERKKSKDQILDYYINKVYMDNQIYGMETASKTYYGKSLKELSLAQTALLAGMPQAPTSYDPYTSPEAAKARRDMVLDAMLDNGKITQAECDKAKKVPVKQGLKPLKAQKSKNFAITDNYITEVIKEVEARTGKNPYTSGMKIYTNMDLNAQKYLYKVMNDNSLVEYPVENPRVKGDEMKTATTVMDVTNGQVLAQLGDRDVDKKIQRGQNLAVDGRRDVGSTTKPFTDYAPAIEYLHYSTGKPVLDQPYYYADTRMKVNNYDLRYRGQLTMREALIDSRNIPAMEFFDAVGPDRIKKFLKDGFDYEVAGGLNQASAISQDMSSLQLASIYTAFANGGTYYKPYYVSKVEFNDGDTLDYEPDGHRAMSEATAYMITDMLKDVISHGTGTTAAIPGLIQAGKTGTSNYSKKVMNRIIGDKNGVPDVSFVGYTPKYCISVWTGYTNYFRSISEQYQHNSQEVYRLMMSYLTDGQPVENWKQPSDVVAMNGQLYVKGYLSGQNTPVHLDSATVRENMKKDGHEIKDGEAQPTPSDDGTVVPSSSTDSSSSSSSSSGSSTSFSNSTMSTSTSSAEFNERSMTSSSSAQQEEPVASSEEVAPMDNEVSPTPVSP